MTDLYSFEACVRQSLIEAPSLYDMTHSFINIASRAKIYRHLKIVFFFVCNLIDVQIDALATFKDYCRK